MIIRSSGLLTFLALWEIAPRWGWADPQFLPPLSSVLKAAVVLWDDGFLMDFFWCYADWGAGVVN
ncbi:hypothetical protein [Pelosinus fermentans]|uniref:hypothetical protein n=1 Tax=Pelosinus fermentans TaxID=365349 RepID=UPI001ED9113E|nr:hypothetical protein [Pelosinus fermentans]